MDKKTAKKKVDLLIADLSDRRGIGDEFEACTTDIKREIRNAWIEILMEEIYEIR